MGLQTEHIELAWSSLQDSVCETGWRSIPIGSIGSCSLRAGLSFPDKTEALLAIFPPSIVSAAEKLPIGTGFSVTRFEPDMSGFTWLALTRSAQGSKELFKAMTTDVIHTINGDSNIGERQLLRLFLGRIRAWQEFMRKGVQVLSAESEIGLVGELTLLRIIIDEGVPLTTAIESWVGPFDGVRDFELGTGSLEVKTTLSIQGLPVIIGSLDQLDDSARQPLFLAGVRLRQTEVGQTLPELVMDMRGIVAKDQESLRLLNERLVAAGYLDDHYSGYIRRFTQADIRIVEVKDDFPRLTFGSVPLGITKATYGIDLDKVTILNTAALDVFKKLGVI